MNTCSIIGRLTNDPEQRTSQSGKQVARYTLAVDRKGKDKGADFIRCVAFDRTAEFAGKYLNKGMKIAVTGTIHTDSYEKDGQKIYSTEVWVNEHYFCESRSNAPQETRSRDNYSQRENPRAMFGEGFTPVVDEAPFV